MSIDHKESRVEMARSSRYSTTTLRRVVQGRDTIRKITPHHSWFKGDHVLWLIISVLAIFSILVVYSSTAKMAYDHSAIRSTTEFLQQQIAMVVFGAIIIFGVTNLFSSQFFRGIAPWVLGLSLLTTMATYVVGVSTNGAARWISILGFQFQPSEALKISIILYLARVLAERQRKIAKMRIVPSLNIFKWATAEQQAIFKEGFLPIVAPVLLSCVVVAPAHTSSAILIFGSSMVMMMIGRVSIKELFKLTAIIVSAGILLLMVGAGRSDTVGGRLSTWQESWMTDRQMVAIEDLSDTDRAMIAIYNGGLAGVGAGQSTMRVEMIHPESDYAFALFVEEYGSIIAIVLLTLYVWIFFRAITIFKRCGTIFPALLVLGLAVMITTQALLHIAVAINFMPETGQNLPLISRGGSSLIFNAIALGMILCVARQNEESSHDMPRSQSMYEE